MKNTVRDTVRRAKRDEAARVRYPVLMPGAGEGIRTLDLLFTNYLHCRLPISIYVFFVFLMRFAFPRS
jgi:hypothetical protein